MAHQYSYACCDEQVNVQKLHVSKNACTLDRKTYVTDYQYHMIQWEIKQFQNETAQTASKHNST